MSSTDPTAVLLPIVRWTAPREPVHLEILAEDIPDLAESQVVGTIVLDGYADVNVRETIAHLTVSCKTREICARSLDEFEYELTYPLTILLRREKSTKKPDWDEEAEETFMVTVPEDLRELDITEIVRQTIELERPLSPIKPGVDLPEGVLPDDVPIEEPKEEPEADPRWNALRKLKGQ
jgi:uncharacterized metal-binding protein YceD (DUF177 family)